MSSLLKELEEKAHKLSPGERGKLIHELIISLDDAIDTEIENAWNDEIEKRIKDIKSGKAKGKPAEEIIAQIRAKYS